MSVKQPRRTKEFLKALADFLNSAHPNVTEKEWRSFRKKIKKTGIGSFFYSTHDRVTLEEAKDIRTEMHHDALEYLHRDVDYPPYEALVGCLNDLELKTQYQCYPKTGKPAPGKAILHSHGKRWVSEFWPTATNTKQLLYTILAAALVDGTLNRLKFCPHCEKYTVVKDTKQRFCSDRCKVAYWNKRRLEDGSFEMYRLRRMQT